MTSIKRSVIVVGGGIIGCSIAWRLAQTGVAVTVIDAGEIGGESSWAGAGMLAPGGEIKEDTTWARRCVESLKMYAGFVDELQRESGVPVDYRQCGALEFPESTAEWPRLVKRARAQAALGIASEEGEGFLYFPDDSIVNSRDMIAALKVLLALLGARLIPYTAVDAIEDGAVVLHGGGKMTADWIVNAAGAWASGLMRDHDAPKSHPVKGHLIGYFLDPGTFPQIQRRGHIYVMQRSSGFTIAGSTTELVGFDRTVNAEAVNKLHETARTFLPDPPDKPDEAWIGFRPGADGDPVVMRWRDTRVWLAYGHYRNGILLAPHTARMVAEGLGC